MIVIALGFAVFYLTSVLRFSIEDTGPYPQQRKDVAMGVINESTKDRDLVKRPVGLFDYLRRLFGVYAISKDVDGYEIWIIHNYRMQVWACPFCLGFWVSFVLSVFFVIWYQAPQEFFINWLAAAGINAFLIRILNRES